jgi:Calx-beta domain/Met-zincin
MISDSNNHWRDRYGFDQNQGLPWNQPTDLESDLLGLKSPFSMLHSHNLDDLPPIRSISTVNIIANVINLAENKLIQFAHSDDLENQITAAYGNSWNREKAQEIFSKFAVGDFSDLPQIDLLTGLQINQANGAYDSQNNRIYLATDFVNSHSENHILAVVLEEIGHSIDFKINQQDAAGDEGDIFSRLVRGENISGEELLQLKAENDWANITLNGQMTPIEQAAVTLSGDSQIDGILSDYKWGFTWGNNTLTYSFYKNSVFNGSYYGTETGVKEVSEAVKTNVRSILNGLSNMINVTFQEVTETASNYGRLRFMLSDDPSYGYGYYPSDDNLASVAGDVHLNPNSDLSGSNGNYFQNPPGNHGYQALIHEIGHTLGLKHPFDGSTILPVDQDNQTNTIMTYNFTGNSPGTYMPYDVKALQYLYGAKSYNANNTTYQFSSSIDKFSINSQTFLNTTKSTKQTIWDSGGIDTLDLTNLVANTSGYHLDINGGGILTTNDAYNGTTYTVNGVDYTTTTYGSAIAFNVGIENVINSRSNDTIYANSLANVFSGYNPLRITGNDVIYNANSQDKLELSAYTSVTQTQSGNDLIIGLGSNGSITIKDYYAGNNLSLLLYQSSLPTITIKANDNSAGEIVTGLTENPGQFTLTRTGATTNALTVGYTISGTATNNADYTAIANTVTFAAGSSTALININVKDDAVYEGNENVVLILNGNIGYNLGTAQTATVNIVENDLPTITISANDNNSGEIVTGLTQNPGQFTLTRTGATTNALTVGYTLSGTAINGTDYNSLTGNVTFAAGSSTALINLIVKDDTVYEGNENVILTLNAGTAYNLGTANSATVNIVENDKPTITIAANDNNSGEIVTGLTQNPGQFTLTRSGNTASALTVGYTVSGTATKGTDYTSITNTVTFAAGSSTAIVNITPIDDLIYEGNETVILTLNTGTAYNLGTTKTATVNIVENDPKPVIAIAANDNNSGEILTGLTQNPGQFTLTRTVNTAGALTVGYTITGTAINGTDYTAIANTVTFADGSSTALINLNVKDDLIYEGNETAILTLNSGTLYSLDTTNTATVNIVENDLPTIAIAANDNNSGEILTGLTQNPGQLTLTRSGNTAIALTVGYTVSGTATKGTDYTSIANTVTFAAGSSTAIVNINPIDDLIYEGNETVILTLNTGTAYNLGTTKTATVNIVENDKPTITISANDNNSGEIVTGLTQNPGQFTLTRSGNTAIALTVGYTVSGTATKGTDYTSIANSVTFAAGSSTAIVNITPIDDLIYEGNETVILTLNTSSAYNIGTANTATVNIVENDPKPTITIVANDNNSGEIVTGLTQNPGQFTLTRTGATTSALTVNYTVSGTATNGTDYNSLPGTATFAAGSATTLINVNVTDDSAVESNETVVLTLNNGSVYTVGTANSATVNIADNDVNLPTITISANDNSASEILTGQTQNPGQFTLTRTGDTTNSLTVNYTVSGTATNGTDYNSLTGTATFAAGSATTLINVNVTDDSAVESNETVVLTLNTNNAYIIGTANTATVTIADNDSANNLAQISNFSFSGNEGDAGTFQVRLNQAPTSNVTMTFNPSSFLTIDADNIINNGTQKTITFTSSNWNVNQTVKFIAEVDGSNVNRTSGNTISYTLTGGQTGTDSYNLGTIINTYSPDNTKFNIDLDFRNDYLGFWTTTRRAIAQKAADDWAKLIANELPSLTLPNDSAYQYFNSVVDMYNPTTSQPQGELLFQANRMIDDIVIFVGAYNTDDGYGGMGNGYGILPRYGWITLNTMSSWNDTDLYTTTAHEIGHSLGLLWGKQDLIYDSGTSLYFTGAYSKAFNGNNNVPMMGYVHPDYSVSSIMSYGYTGTTITEMDKRFLADIGYQVYGVNA